MSTARKLSSISLQENISSMNAVRDQLMDVPEMVAELMEQKKPLYAERLQAIVRGDTRTCDRCNRELRRISAEIEALTNAARELAEAESDRIRELLRPGEEVAK